MVKAESRIAAAVGVLSDSKFVANGANSARVFSVGLNV